MAAMTDSPAGFSSLPPQPDPAARLLALELVTRHQLRLAAPRDERLGPLLAARAEIAAASWTGRYAALVLCYRPAPDQAEAAEELGLLLAEAVRWGAERMQLKQQLRADILLIALGPVAAPRHTIAAPPAVSLAAAWMDSAGGRAEWLGGRVKGLPDLRDLRTCAQRAHEGAGVPTLAAIDLAEKQGLSANYSRPAHAVDWRANPRNRGFFGTIAAIGFALLKWGGMLLKGGALGPTFVSMALSMFLAAQFYGWGFGVGLILMFLVHEVGHMIAATAGGIPVSLPTFLGPFGAFVRHAHVANPRVQAAISVMGPAVGSLGGVACLAVAMAFPALSFRPLLLNLAQLGFFLNLFNLVPFGFLDGAKVIPVIAGRTLAVAAALAGAIYLVAGQAGRTASPLLLIVAAACAFMAWRNWSVHITGRASGLFSDRGVNGLFVAVITVCCVGMAVTAAELVPAVRTVDQSSSSQF
jgi:Zn-dependent protease